MSAASDQGDQVKYVNTASLDLRYRQETAEDVVAASDQVVIVSADSVEEIEDMPLSPGERDDPRPFFREITFRVESSVWERPGGPHLSPDSEFAAITGGTLSAEPERQKTTFKGIAFIEPGERYLMPIKERQGHWSPELPLATFPLVGSNIDLAPHQKTRLAREISGKALSSLSEVFALAGTS